MGVKERMLLVVIIVVGPEADVYLAAANQAFRATRHVTVMQNPMHLAQESASNPVRAVVSLDEGSTREWFGFTGRPNELQDFVLQLGMTG